MLMVGPDCLALILAPSLTCCVTLGESPSLSEPQSPHV